MVNALHDDPLAESVAIFSLEGSWYARIAMLLDILLEAREWAYPGLTDRLLRPPMRSLLVGTLLPRTLRGRLISKLSVKPE